MLPFVRKYFAEYIEKAAFECFHFRHRPEDRREENRSAGDGTTKKVNYSKFVNLRYTYILSLKEA